MKIISTFIFELTPQVIKRKSKIVTIFIDFQDSNILHITKNIYKTLLLIILRLLRYKTILNKLENNVIN